MRKGNIGETFLRPSDLFEIFESVPFSALYHLYVYPGNDPSEDVGGYGGKKACCMRSQVIAKGDAGRRRPIAGKGCEQRQRRKAEIASQYGAASGR